jgi:hypothetical protein
MSSARLSFSLITLLSLAACGGSNTPATNADSGATPTGSVATICAAARRLACTGVTNCESEIGAVFNGFPARCAAARDAYFACAARATNTTCEMISTGQFSSCEALGRTLESCGGDSDSGTPNDDGVMPTTDTGSASCGATGASCCAGASPCQAGNNCNTTSNTCEACGADGQICCPATSALCASGLRCSPELRCSTTICGEAGEPCCAGSTCIGVNTCEMGTCTAPF